MQNNSNSTDYQDFEAVGGGRNSSNTKTLNYRNWTYTLPDLNGQILTTPTGARSVNASLSLDGGAVPSFYMVSLSSTSITAFNLTNGVSIPMFTLSLLMRVSSQPSDAGAISSADVCALSFCAQRRNVSMSLNELSSTILQTVYSTHIWGKTDLSETATWLSFTGDNINMTYPSNLTGINAGNGLSWGSWGISLQALVDTFAGNVTVPLKWADRQEISDSSSNALTALSESPDIPMTMDNVASAMTNYFRNSSNATVVGQAGQSEVYICVTWPWIALPALLVSAGTVFLILVMLETKRRGVCVWKTSELAVLFHGLGGLEQEFAAINSESEIEHVAGGIRVRMVNADGRGWTLRQEKAPMKES